MERNKRRHSTGFGYIGFGNNQSVFNQSTRKAFSSLKEKLNEESHFHHQVDFLHKTLSKKEKQAIKTKIKNRENKRTRKTIILFVILAVPVFFFFKFFIDKLASNF